MGINEFGSKTHSSGKSLASILLFMVSQVVSPESIILNYGSLNGYSNDAD